MAGGSQREECQRQVRRVGEPGTGVLLFPDTTCLSPRHLATVAISSRELDTHGLTSRTTRSGHLPLSIILCTSHFLPASCLAVASFAALQATLLVTISSFASNWGNSGSIPTSGRSLTTAVPSPLYFESARNKTGHLQKSSWCTSIWSPRTERRGLQRNKDSAFLGLLRQAGVFAPVAS